MRDREATLRKVLDFLDVALPEGLEFDPPALERQADDMSEEWVARYLADSTSR